MKAQLTHFVLSAALILTGLPWSGFSQGNKPDATIDITAVTIRSTGNDGSKIIEVAWKVSALGGAVPQKFDVRADARLQGGGISVKTLAVNGEARFAKLLFTPFNVGGAGNASGGGIINQAEEVKGKIQTKEAKNPAPPATNTIGELKNTIELNKGNKGQGNAGSNNAGGTVGTIKPAPKPAGPGQKFFIESAFVTVTGVFRANDEAINLTREFVPPANPTGELKPRNGGGNADVVLNKLIEIKKSPRANQCAAGRDCFEVATGAKDFLGNGGKGFTVNLEALYADGSRKTAAEALPAPGRSVLLTVDNPKNLAFTSVRVSLRGQGDGLFTRKATRDELLSF